MINEDNGQLDPEIQKVINENFFDMIGEDTGDKLISLNEACEWWIEDLLYPSMTQEEHKWVKSKVNAFRKAMKGGREMKKCINCQLFRQLKYKGGETWYNYCHRDGYLNPCSGGKCDFPKYFKPIKEDKK